MGETALAFIRARIREQNCGYVTPCWVWQLGLTKKGYARTKVPGFGPGLTRVHRASFELKHGAIPDGLVIDHLCRVKACCNPAHLEAVTAQLNNCRQHDNRPGQCVRGHTVADHVDRHGNCRLCARGRDRAYRQRPENKAKHAAYMRIWTARRRVEQQGITAKAATSEFRWEGGDKPIAAGTLNGLHRTHSEDEQ